MSLDLSKLERVRHRGKKTVARCPACAEVGHDRRGEHLVIDAESAFSCVIYSGDSAEAKAHRKRIFALSGNHKIQPLVVQKRDSGTQLWGPKPVLGVLKRILGRQGRLSGRIAASLNAENDVEADTKIDGGSGQKLRSQSQKSVRAVRNRTLTKHERSLLVCWCGSDNDPLILEAIKLFNATIVGIKTASVKRCKLCGAEFYGWPESKFCSPQCWQKRLTEPMDEKARLKSCLNYLRDFEARLERMRKETEQRNAEL
jgi:hypothetical protein